MKHRILITLAIVLSLLLGGCAFDSADNINSQKSKVFEGEYGIAMITDSGDITDMSFNQTSYEACRIFAKENNIPFTCKKPNMDSTKARNEMIELAINEGYNILVLPGYQFAASIVDLSSKYPQVKFIALDITESDILSAALGDDYDYIPENYDVTKYYNSSNTYCSNYHEEIAGYMAGYAAVKLGYKKLGFLGGIDVPSVIRYGYGYLSGIEAAAKELDIVSDISVRYAYAGQFFGDPVITNYCSDWYKEGTEVIFSCGGGIYTSVCEAAFKYDGKVIGVDVDQAEVINAYGEDIAVTSAMKGLSATISITLSSIINENTWQYKAGRIETLGLISALDMQDNFVQLADSTVFSDSFSREDYKNLVWDIISGKKIVDRDITVRPELEIDVYFEPESIQ